MVGGGDTAVGLLVGLSLGFIIFLDIHNLSQTPFLSLLTLAVFKITFVKNILK